MNAETPLYQFPGILPGLPEASLVEVLDEGGQPLVVMPLESAMRQRLRHRYVCVLFFDADKRLVLARKPVARGRAAWDLPARGPVWAGEAREDAARRLLREELGIERPRVLECPPPVIPPRARVVTSVFRADAAESPRMSRNTERLQADVDELAALAREFSEMLAPGLLRLLEQYLLPEGLANPAGQL